MKIVFYVSTLMIFISLNANALPILAESEDGQGLLATIYPDHENSKKFYFFPNAGGLEQNENGEPRFGMTHWTPSSENATAGYFSGIFRLRLTENLKSAVEGLVKEGKQLAVVPVQKSYLSFMKNEKNEAIMTDIFKEVSMPPFSGRAEDSMGISGTLTRDGAQVMSAILGAGGNAADLHYCYEIRGLSPLFHANIQLNYHKVYTHFLAQSSGGRWWWKWSIRTEVEKLIESGDIRIHINGGNANQYDYIMALADRMIAKFMEAKLENRRGTTSGRFGISYTQIIEDRDISFDLKQRELIDREFCVSLGMDELKNYPWLITKNN